MSASRAVGCRLSPHACPRPLRCRVSRTELRAPRCEKLPPRGTTRHWERYVQLQTILRKALHAGTRTRYMHAVEEMCILYARWRRIDPTRHKRTCGGHCVLSVGVELLALPHFKTRQMTSLASRARPSHPAWPQVQLQRRAGDMISLAQIGHVGGHHRYHLLLTLRRK